MKPSSRQSLLWLVLLISVSLFCCQQTTDEVDDTEDEEPKITVPSGFTLDELYRPTDRKMGTWVALAEAPNGRFYACDQWGDIYYFQIPAIGEVLDSTQVDSLDLDIGRAHGLMWAFNSLYVAVNYNWERDDEEVKHGSGVYRLTDKDNDGNLDHVELLLRLDGAGEHGPHSFVLSPDETEIYFIAGNHTKIPDEVKKNSRISTNWDEDNLLPPYLDARGHANEIKAPGGWIAKMDPEGNEWELISVGYRNPFDFAFNDHGELFVFDADMEWDFGMPWYRPIRVCHATSGSEFGWRTGSGKWPTYYPDALPSVVDLGQGSPTGVLFGAGLSFPSRYQRGLFINDWSFGTMYFIELTEDGSSYRGSKEEFIYGIPFPLTEVIAGSDGHMYFAVGGRRLESRFYRLRYTGNSSTEAPQAPKNEINIALRDLRHSIEALHTGPKPGGVTLSWSHLDHDDRFIRYAARIALEHQPLDRWKNLALIEKDADKAIAALIALARVAEPEPDLQRASLSKLNALNWDELTKDDKLDLLRAYELILVRMGMPQGSMRQRVIERLQAFFPGSDDAINREAAEILIFLGDEKTTADCMTLLDRHTEAKTMQDVAMLTDEVSDRHERYGKDVKAVIENMPPAEAIFYAMILSHAKNGWNETLRQDYFQWYFDVLSTTGGNSFKAFIENIRQMALQNAPETERQQLEELSGVFSPAEEMANLPQPEGPGDQYNAHDLHRVLGDGLKDYKGQIDDGEKIFAAALCSSCHRMHGEGGINGPDLTQLHTRFDRGDMINAIFSPNDEISDQYAFTLFELKDGSKIAGKVFSEEGDAITIMPNPYTSSLKVDLAKSDVTDRRQSPVSPMPPGLLNRLNKQEITDLFAYLLSGADENHKYYGGEPVEEESD